MVIVYDTGYIRAEIFRVWSRVFIHIAGIGAGDRRYYFADRALEPCWTDRTRGAVDESTPHCALLGARPPNDLDFFLPLAREMGPLAKSMRQARAAAAIEARLRNTNESLWTAERLADHVRTKLDGSNLFVGLQSRAIRARPPRHRHQCVVPPAAW